MYFRSSYTGLGKAPGRREWDEPAFVPSVEPIERLVQVDVKTPLIAPTTGIVRAVTEAIPLKDRLVQELTYQRVVPSVALLPRLEPKIAVRAYGAARAAITESIAPSYVPDEQLTIRKVPPTIAEPYARAISVAVAQKQRRRLIESMPAVLAVKKTRPAQPVSVRPVPYAEPLPTVLTSPAEVGVVSSAPDPEALSLPTFIDVAEAQVSPYMKYGLYALGAYILYDSMLKTKPRRTRRRTTRRRTRRRRNPCPPRR